MERQEMLTQLKQADAILIEIEAIVRKCRTSHYDPQTGMPLNGREKDGPAIVNNINEGVKDAVRSGVLHNTETIYMDGAREVGRSYSSAASDTLLAANILSGGAKFLGKIFNADWDAEQIHLLPAEFLHAVKLGILPAGGAFVGGWILYKIIGSFAPRFGLTLFAIGIFAAMVLIGVGNFRLMKYRKQLLDECDERYLRLSDELVEIPVVKELGPMTLTHANYSKYIQLVESGRANTIEDLM